MSERLTTMNPVTASTANGTPIGTASGVVHIFGLLGFVDNRIYSLCGRKLRGALVERAGEEVACQACIDEHDYRAAIAAGFLHHVHASRVPLGHSPVAENNAMRYGARVVCYTCPAPARSLRTVWSVNKAGQMREAEKIARQHFLEAYRESLAVKPEPEPVTAISPARLAELRAEGRAKVGQFVDPFVLSRLNGVLNKRGETWAAAILGRDISRRSVGVPSMPWLISGEEYALVDADVEEDKARFDQIIDAETGD